MHLLPGFDEYCVAYRETKVDTGLRLGAGVVLLDGEPAGEWRRTANTRELLVEVVLHVPFDAAQTAALKATVEAHGTFLRLPAVMSEQTIMRTRS